MGYKMPIILKNTLAGRRAFFIESDHLELMVEEGRAIRCEGYDIYEEVTDEEVSQGYMTRNMAALPVPGKKRGRPSKPKEVIVMSDEDKIDEVTEATEEVAEVESSEVEESAEEKTEE